MRFGFVQTIADLWSSIRQPARVSSSHQLRRRQRFVPLQMLESRLLLTQFPATGQWEIYSVEKTLPLPLGKSGAYIFNAVHSYLVLANPTGKDIAEVHGVYSKTFFTLGYTLPGNYLQVALYTPDSYMADDSVLSYKAVVGGTQSAITTKFLNAYNTAASALNKTHDLYEAASLISSSNTYNSNSAWLTEMDTLVSNPYKFEGPYRGPGDTIDLTKAPSNNPDFGNPAKDPYVNLPLKGSLSFTNANNSQNPDNGFDIAEDAYQDTTNPSGGGILFEGAKKIGSNLAANIDINKLTLASGSAGYQITSLNFLAHNFGASRVKARPTLYVWATNGAGGGPGTLLGEFRLPITQFNGDANTQLSFTVPSGSLTVPKNTTIWAGIGFDNDNGATAITAGQLNALGGLTYPTASVGTDGSQAYFLPPNFALADPAVVAFGARFGADYGWMVTTEQKFS